MVNLAEKFDWKIKKATIKTLSRFIMFFSLLLVVESMTLAETRIGDQVLLTRESIVRNTKKEVILKNKNIEFKELSQIKIMFGNASVECFFGYQNESKLVLCYK